MTTELSATPDGPAAAPPPRPREPVRTVANAITLVRTVAAAILGVAALTQSSMLLLAVGYGVYWVGDIADGAAARWLDQETRHGAVFDIVSDRLCTSLLAAAFLVQVPEAVVPLTIFLLQFMVLDSLLSLSFLYWPIKGPNEFGRVDPLVHRLNWSPPAKALNSAVVVLLILAGLPVPATAVAVLVTLVKLWTARRILTLVGGSPADA